MLIYLDLFFELVDEDVLFLVLSCPVFAASRSIGLRYSVRFQIVRGSLATPYFYGITCIGCDYPGFSSSILTAEFKQSGYETIL